MRSFLVAALWVSASHARRVQITIEQPASSREKVLASVLLALQPTNSNLNRQVRAPVVPNTVRTSPFIMMATDPFGFSSAPSPASFDDSMMSGGAPAGGGAPLQKLGPDGVWGLEAKKRVFDAWDPEKARDYNNFNPFERNNEGSLCDVNGCFPGQSKGYQSPLRPDQTWEIVQKEDVVMDEIKKDPKFQIKEKPGNFHDHWQKNLGRPPAS